MQNVTEEYKEAMKLPIRNNSTAMVTIGDVDVDVQTTATGRDGYFFLTMYFVAPFYGTNNNVLFRTGTDVVYGTLEQNFVKADGKKLFPPEEGQTELYLDTGFVGREVMNDTDNRTFQINLGDTEIDAPFTVAITFAETAPTRGEVAIWNGSNNVYKTYTSADIVNNKLVVTFDTLPALQDDYTLNIVGYSDTIARRLRISNIVFGTGMMLDAEIVKKIETKYYCSRINEELPTSDCTVEILNYEQRYDADNPENPLAILDEEKQTINVMFGYDVTGEGDYEWVHGGRFMVNDWNSDVHSAKVMSRDILQGLDEPYIHNNDAIMGDSPHSTLADWVLDICGYGEITQFDNKIPVLFDADLWDIECTIPMPTLPRKECLQLIANYSCKSMYIDREGRVVISSRSATTEEETVVDVVISEEGQPFPDPIEGDVPEDYDYLYAQITRNEDGLVFNVPVASNDETWEVSPADYGVEENGKIAIFAVKNTTVETEVTSDDIKENITTEKEELIKSVIVPYYAEIYKPIAEEGIGKNLFDMDNLENGNISSSGAFIDATNRVRNHDFMVLDEGLYTINAPGFQVSMMVYDPTNRYIASESYSNWYDCPKGMTLTNKRKCIFIFRKSSNVDIDPMDLQNVQLEFGGTATTYEIYESSRQIWSEDITGDTEGNCKLEVDLGSMYTGVKIRVDGRTVDGRNYADTINDNQLHIGTGVHRVAIDAECETLYTSQNYVYPVNDTGKELEWKNPLVDTFARASFIAHFVGEYLRSNISYDYDYRGNPEYDANDTVLQENDFVPDMQTIITEHTIDFNGALSGHITARRRIE